LEVTRIEDPTRDRYRALSLNSAWKLEIIRKASALIIGAGALGNEVGKNLALMGVRLIAVVDRDTVEVANLTRSVFFRESDHGSMKAETLADRLIDLNPDVTVLPLNGDLDRVVGLGLVRRMDMVFSCLDNRLARRSINRMCQKLGKAWIDGSMENLLGDVTVYLPNDGPCYECNLTQNDKAIIAEATSCQHIALQNLAMGKIPTISTMGSIISALQVQEGLKILHEDFSPSIAAKRLVVNCEINDFYSTRADRKDECDGHFRYGDITEMPNWSVSHTTAREILQHFEREKSVTGHLRLGREVVIGLRCHQCNSVDDVGEVMQFLTSAMILCSVCGSEREVITTNVINGDERFSEWPLSRLGIPRLDILEVRAATSCVWYEMTGDLSSLNLAD